LNFFAENDVILLFKKVKGKIPLTQAEAKEVSVFLKEYHQKLIDKWKKVFVYHQQAGCEVISIKLKRKKK